MKRTRHAPGLLCVWLIAHGMGCAQSDMVALRKAAIDSCDAGACVQSGMCAARSCSALQTHGDVCSGDTPLIEIGDGCSPSMPNQSFRFAVCSCTDFVTVSTLRVDNPGSTAIGVDHDLHVGSDVRVDGSIQLGGVLFSSGAAPAFSSAYVEHAPPPCACDGTSLLDLTQPIAAAKSDNDDSAGGLTKDDLNGFSGSRELQLGCGRYYFSRIAGSGALTIHAQGRVALFVEGNIELQDDFVIDTGGTAQVWLFVGGNVQVTGHFEVGASDDHAATRVLVAGDGTVNLESDSVLGGVLYAPRADLVTGGRFEIYGALFAQRVVPAAALLVHYDSALADVAANSCAAPR